ncbi:MAG: gluconokinase [Blastocatellia bacterium]|jgi:gluconokinase|nr:gluconokinase [Blastocatellia bacterium]
MLNEIASDGVAIADPYLISQALNDEPETPIVLSVDIGTSGVRAMLFDGRGNEIESAQVRPANDLYNALSSGADADPDQLFNHVLEAIDLVLGRSAKTAGVDLVGISCFWHSLIGVDAAGRGVTPLFGWADTRAAAAVEQLKVKLDERETHQRTGCRFHPSYWPAKLLWLQTERAAKYRSASRWLSFAEYLQNRLLGQSAMSISMASGTGLFNQHTCDWDDALLRELDLVRERLPPLADSGQTFTTLEHEYALRWPALVEAKWFPAIADGAANNVGSGCVTDEFALLMIGTSGAMRVVQEGPPPANLPAGLWCYRLDRRRVIVGGALSDGGSVYRWLRESLDLGNSESNIESSLAAMEPDAHGLTVLPFWAGERSTGWNASARGAILGLHANTEPLEILRAAMEGVAYRFALIAEALQSVSRNGVGKRTIVGTGNALLASPCWTQIVADVLGQDVHLARTREASCRGAALMALESKGKLGDIASLPIAGDRIFIPDMSRHEKYRAARERQQQAYDRLFG